MMESPRGIQAVGDRLVDLELDNMRARSRRVDIRDYSLFSSSSGIHVYDQVGGYIFLPSDTLSPLPKENLHLKDRLSRLHDGLQTVISLLSEYQLVALHKYLDNMIDESSSEGGLNLAAGPFGFENNNPGSHQPEPKPIRSGLKAKAQLAAQAKLSQFRASPLFDSDCFKVTLIHLEMTGNVTMKGSFWPKWAAFDGFMKGITAEYSSMTGSLGGWATVKQRYLQRVDSIIQSGPNPLWQVRLKKELPRFQELEGTIPAEIRNLELGTSPFDFRSLISEPVDLDKLAMALERTERLADSEMEEDDWPQPGEWD
ncbi:hypothetical protein EsH8_IV_000594 [Colletotrichum jinshuiense]